MELLECSNTLKWINKLGTSLTTEGRFVLRASLQINTYNTFKEMIKQESIGIFESELIDFGYSYFGLDIPTGG